MGPGIAAFLYSKYKMKYSQIKIIITRAIMIHIQHFQALLE
jgi:hypothetical protein